MVEVFTETQTYSGYETFSAMMRSKLRRCQATKGDSWMTCDIAFLEDKLIEEIEEYLTAKTHVDKKDETIDIANVCMMLYNRHFGLIGVN